MGICVQVNAGAIAQRLTRRAASTNSTDGRLPKLTSVTTHATVLGIGVEVDTGAPTLGQPAETDTGTACTD